MPGLRSHASNVPLLAILFMVGCPHPVAETAPVEAPLSLHPALVCPAGTVAGGTPPPIGVEVWCQRRDADGRTWVREGPSIGWYRSAATPPVELRSSEGNYVDGVQNGPWIYWYANGNPKMRGSYTLGVQDGPWTTYHPNGGPASKGQYVNGAEQGTWQFWDEESTWRAQGDFVGGHREGLWLEYGPAADPIRERVYRDGQLITVREL